MKTAIQTKDAPAAIGTYSQAVKVGESAGATVYLSGQIGLDPATMQLAEGIDAQTHRVFRNLAAVADAAGLRLEHAVRMTVYLTDLAHFPVAGLPCARLARVRIVTLSSSPRDNSVPVRV